MGGNNPDEDDEMTGAIDLNDVDWASSDVEGGGNDAAGSEEASAVASAAAELMAPTLTTTTPSSFLAAAGTTAVRGPNVPSGGGGAAGAAGAGGAGVAGNGRVSVAAVETGIAAVVPVAASASVMRAPVNYSARATRGSRAQRTCPFSLKACSACKKGKATALQCRLDRRVFFFLVGIG